MSYRSPAALLIGTAAASNAGVSTNLTAAAGATKRFRLVGGQIIYDAFPVAAATIVYLRDGLVQQYVIHLTDTRREATIIIPEPGMLWSINGTINLIAISSIAGPFNLRFSLYYYVDDAT